jgi:hypothetical protein
MSKYIFLKKPYTPVVSTSAAGNFNVYGKSFFRVTNVYLSGYPYENQTFYSPFSSVPKLSASYPGFFGVKLLSSQYTTNNENTITFTMPSATRAGYVDIIVENPAGYGALTQYVIKYPYSGTQSQLELRPWSLGVKVLTGVEIVYPENLLYTLNGLSGIGTFDDKGIITFNILPSSQMFSVTNDVLVTVHGDNILTI